MFFGFFPSAVRTFHNNYVGMLRTWNARQKESFGFSSKWRWITSKLSSVASVFEWPGFSCRRSSRVLCVLKLSIMLRNNEIVTKSVKCVKIYCPYFEVMVFILLYLLPQSSTRQPNMYSVFSMEYSSCWCIRFAPFIKGFYKKQFFFDAQVIHSKKLIRNKWHYGYKPQIVYSSQLYHISNWNALCKNNS